MSIKVQVQSLGVWLFIDVHIPDAVTSQRTLGIAFGKPYVILFLLYLHF